MKPPLDHIVFAYAKKGVETGATLLSDRIIIALKQYFVQFSPHYWLLEGFGRKKYSATSNGHWFAIDKKTGKIDDNDWQWRKELPPNYIGTFVRTTGQIEY